MADLADKYRPTTFGDVVGQTSLIRWLSQQVRSGERRSVLIGGPFGTGKSSSAFIYAKAILCARPQEGEPCMTCDNCKDFGARGEQSPDFLYFKCGEHSTVERVQEVLEAARTVPFLADRRVLLLDEAHNLSRRAFQALLDITEHPPEWATFIIVTSDVKSLPPALVMRLPVRELTLISLQDAVAMLSAVCQREGISFEAAAFALIFSSVGGHPRALLRALEKVSELGAVDEGNVRLALNLDFDDRLISYAEALMAGHLDRQLEVVESWPDTPSRKLQFLHQFFTYVYFSQVRRIVRDDPMMRTLPSALFERLIFCFSEHASRLGMSTNAFWENALRAVDPKEPLTASQLALMLSGLDRLINAPTAVSSAETDPGLRLVRSEDARQRSTRRVTRGAKRTRLDRSNASILDAGYLSWKQLRPVWDVGSFLPQHFGVLFNLRISLTRDATTMNSAEDLADIVSGLTHELSARIAYWSTGALCHWTYRHEQLSSSHSRTTRLLVSVPDALFSRSVQWIETFCRKRAQQSGVRWLLASRCLGLASTAVRFHWQSIRSLSRGLDPQLTGRSRTGDLVPLVDLLRIPRRWRAPTGAAAHSTGSSKHLTPAARIKLAGDMAVLSAIAEGAWDFVDLGWELAEFDARVAERARRRNLLASVGQGLPEAGELTVLRKREELREAHAAFGRDPKQSWPRQWHGWWQGQ